MRRKAVLLVVGALVATLVGGMPTASAKPKADPGPTVYVGELTAEQIKSVAAMRPTSTTPSSGGSSGGGPG